MELRKIAVSMSQQTHTAVTYWLNMPLVDLGEWIDIVANSNKKGGR